MIADHAWTPTPADFDSWTDEDEQAALTEVSQATQVRHIIKDNSYWALVPGGNIYKLPLYLSISQFEGLSSAESDEESFAKIKSILSTFAGPEQAARLEDEPLQVAYNLLQDYGETIAKTQGVADLGKSANSASPSTAALE